MTMYCQDSAALVEIWTDIAISWSSSTSKTIKLMLNRQCKSWKMKIHKAKTHVTSQKKEMVKISRRKVKNATD